MQGFDEHFYKWLYPDLEDVDNLYDHFHKYGRHEGRIGNKESYFKKLQNKLNIDVNLVNWLSYRCENEDLNTMNEIDLIRHYANHGINEGRLITMKSFERLEIEKEYNVHIENGIVYLESKKSPGFFAGKPNIDDKIYLYEGKAKWTQWKLDINYDIIYGGFKFNKSDLEIVISRFNEDLSWSDPFMDIRTIYNKGKDDLNIDCINIENVGREGHTYLYHIILNYENLSKKTIFIKPNHKNHHLNAQWLTFTHGLSNINQFISFSLNDEERYIYFPFLDVCDNDTVSYGPDINGEWKKGYHPHGLGKRSYTKNTMDIDENGNLIHFGKWLDNSRTAKYGSFVSYFKKYIDSNYDNFPEYFLWSPHGIFTVEKEMIRNRSIESYKEILETLSYGEDVQEGHYIERSWYYIFQKYYDFSCGQSCRNILIENNVKNVLKHY